eukprot:4967840-Pleurochrysis_carterae.AAC.1
MDPQIVPFHRCGSHSFAVWQPVRLYSDRSMLDLNLLPSPSSYFARCCGKSPSKRISGSSGYAMG